MAPNQEDTLWAVVILVVLTPWLSGYNAPGGNLSVDQDNDGFADGILQQTFGEEADDFAHYSPGDRDENPGQVRRGSMASEE